MVEDMEDVNGADPEAAESEAEPGSSPYLFSVTNQTPWWIVSILLHALVILFAALVSVSIDLGKDAEAVVMVTELAPAPETKQEEQKKPDSPQALESKHDTPPTDPTSKEANDVVVPPDILEKAELGDHFETVNLDKPDTQSAFGNPDAHMFHSVKGSDDEAGGGGVGGASLEDVIGVGGNASPGSGGGWGGGHGSGVGVDTGAGKGSFGNRNGGGRKLMVKRHGGNRATENGVDSALAWLAYHQEADGHWDGRKYETDGNVDTFLTSISLLAFLGAGHTEKVGQYKDNVRRAVAWLKSKQRANGAICQEDEQSQHHGTKIIGYSAAAAAMAMSEAAGMANIPDTRESAQKAIDYCLKVHQNEADGAYGYTPGDSRLAVHCWFVLAVKSAKVSGLNIPTANIEKALKYVEACSHKVDGAPDDGYGPVMEFYYRTEQRTSGTGGNKRWRLQAMGNLVRLFTGVAPIEVNSSVNWFVQQGGMPQWGECNTMAEGQRTVDIYHWYYGTLCNFQCGGENWTRWNKSMQAALLPSQRKDGDAAGSWDPTGDFYSRWGRVGQTAISCLILEVYYRYAMLNH